MTDEELRKIASEVESEYGTGGLSGGTLYEDFAVDIAKRAIAAERERCATLCESMGSMEALDGEEVGSAAMVRVADRMAELCAAAIRRA